MAGYPLERFLGRHDADEVIAWAKRLRHFYFIGELSGSPVETYESLEMCLTFTGRNDLIAVLQALGVLRFAAPAPRTAQDPWTIGDAEPELRDPNGLDVLQPGECTIAGAPCRVVVSSLRIAVTCGEVAGVSAQTVIDAERIEAFIDAQGYASRVERGIATTPNCISAANFPLEFASR